MRMRFPAGKAKAVTLSYDDGVEQDKRLIDILDRYGMYATFNLNSGLWAKEGTVYQKGTIHRRMTLQQAQNTYDLSRHEVAVHCVTHESLPELPVERMTFEVLQDRINLEQTFGGFVRGAAYPFGTYDDRSVQVLKSCGIQYCRTVQASHSFQVPQDWLRLSPTCHHDDPMLESLCNQFLENDTTYHTDLFYLWGHAYEFEANSNWHVIEQFCDKMGNRDNVWYATNIEIVRYVEAYRRLFATADGRVIHNPTDVSVWVEIQNHEIQEIAPGQSLKCF